MKRTLTTNADGCTRPWVFTAMVINGVAIVLLLLFVFVARADAHPHPPKTPPPLPPLDLAAYLAYEPPPPPTTTTQAPVPPPYVIDCGGFTDDGEFEWRPCEFPEAYRGDVEQFFPPKRVEEAMTVMACESGGNPLAYNPRSGASGLFQHLQRYWEYRSAAAGWEGASIWNPTANVAVAAWLAKDGQRRGLSFWHHWECRKVLD